jgi:hypothetical protein
MLKKEADVLKSARLDLDAAHAELASIDIAALTKAVQQLGDLQKAIEQVVSLREETIAALANKRTDTDMFEALEQITNIQQSDVLQDAPRHADAVNDSLVPTTALLDISQQAATLGDALSRVMRVDNELLAQFEERTRALARLVASGVADPRLKTIAEQAAAFNATLPASLPPGSVEELSKQLVTLTTLNLQLGQALTEPVLAAARRLEDNQATDLTTLQQAISDFTRSYEILPPDLKQDIEPPLVFVHPEVGREFFDQQVRERLGISGKEFLQKWESGDYDSIADDPNHVEIMELAMLRPFGR